MSRPGVKAPPTAVPLRGVLVLLGWVAGAGVFFRRPISSGFRFVTGDNGDTRLIIYLHEHWLQALQGRASWRNPPFFYPAADTLGYTDTFFLDELFYAPLRWSGMDQFLAYQFTLVGLSLVGYLGCHRLLGRILVGHSAVRAGLVLTFTSSNTFAVQAGHTQLYAMYWIPAVVLLVLRARAAPGRPVGPALLAGLAVGLLFFSTFYVAWFSTCASLLFLMTRGLLVRLGDRGRARHRIRDMLSRNRTRILGAMAGAGVGGLPFLLVYLPNMGSSRSFDVVADYAAQPRDILNTGSRNYLWGSFTRAVYGSSPRLANGEFGFGLTPGLLVALSAATVYLVRRFARNVGDRPSTGVALATALTCWSAIVLPMKVFGLSLWYPVWLLVPGARAVRAIDRVGVVAALLVPVVVAFVMADLLARPTAAPTVRRRLQWGCVAVTLVLTLEQFNVGGSAGLDRPAQLAALQRVPDPPAHCRVFYLAGTDTPARLAYVGSVDAMLIAQTITSRGIPLATVNGFSGHFPAAFGEAADPGSSGYDAAVQAWITAHHLGEGVCRYHLASQRWDDPSS